MKDPNDYEDTTERFELENASFSSIEEIIERAQYQLSIFEIIKRFLKKFKNINKYKKYKIKNLQYLNYSLQQFLCKDTEDSNNKSSDLIKIMYEAMNLLSDEEVKCDYIERNDEKEIKYV